MPDEDSSQSAPSEPTPIEVPVSPEPTPLEPIPVSDAPVADTPVAELPVEVPVENPIAEPIPPTPVESASVNNSPAPVIISPAAPDHSSSVYLKSLVPLSLAERNRRRQAHIEKLINHAAVNGSTSRREAQILLRVTGATADRYIKELISQGRLAKENNARYTKYKFVR